MCQAMPALVVWWELLLAWTVALLTAAMPQEMPTGTAAQVSAAWLAASLEQEVPKISATVMPQGQ